MTVPHLSSTLDYLVKAACDIGNLGEDALAKLRNTALSGFGRSTLQWIIK
jgi:hypothetical protein